MMNTQQCSRFFSGTLVMVLSLLSWAVEAASVTAIPDGGDGKSYLVLVGEISEGDAELLKNAAAKLTMSTKQPLRLRLDSPGGDVLEAIKIGRWAHQQLVEIRVYGKTFYDPSTRHGSMIANDGARVPSLKSLFVVASRKDSISDKLVRCSSSCVLLFMGGIDRLARDNSDDRFGDKGVGIPVIGLHRPYFEKERFAELTPDQARQSYRALEYAVRAYLTDMEVPQLLIDRMFRASSQEIDFVADDKFSELIQQKSSFLDEWLIAKCGRGGPEGALTPDQLEQYLNIRQLAKKRYYAGELTDQQFLYHEWDPEDVKPGTFAYLYSLILLKNRTVVECTKSAVVNHQITWAKEWLHEMQ